MGADPEATGAAERITGAGGALPRFGGSGAVTVHERPSLPADWAAQLDQAADDEEVALLLELATTTTVPAPRVGYESDEGIIITVAWPDHRVAAYLSPDPDDRRDLEAVGWHVLAADVAAIAAVLGEAPRSGLPHQTSGEADPRTADTDARAVPADARPAHVEEGR